MTDSDMLRRLALAVGDLQRHEREYNGYCPHPDFDFIDGKPCEHSWTGQRMGGDPAEASSGEWVAFCKHCGMEKVGD